MRRAIGILILVALFGVIGAFATALTGSLAGVLLTFVLTAAMVGLIILAVELIL